MLTCSGVPGDTAPLGVFLKGSSSFSPLEKGSLKRRLGLFLLWRLHQNSAALVEGLNVTHPNSQNQSTVLSAFQERFFGKKRKKFTSAYSPSRNSSLVLSNVL